MAKKLTIELGNSLVKLMELNYGPAVATGKHAEFYIEDGIVADGVILDVEKLAEKIRENTMKLGIKTKNVIFTINSSRIASREVTLPRIKSNKLDQVVETNASTYFPVNMDEYRTAYRVLGDSEDDPLKKQVQIFIAPKKMLSDYMMLAEELDLNVESFDYAGNSVFQIAKLESKTGTRLIVKIDENSSQLTVIKDQTQMMQRSISYGMDLAVSDVMKDKKISFMDALTFLRENDVVAISDDDDDSSYFEELVTGIVKTLDFYNGNHVNEPVEKIIITGAGSDIRGIGGEISRITGVMVHQLKLTTPFNTDKMFKGSCYGQYIDCMGAVLQPLGFVEKKKGSSTEGSTDMGRVSVIVFVGCILISFALAGVSLINYMNAKNANEERKLYLNSLSYVADSYNAHQTALAENMYLKDLEATTQNRNEDIVNFINELEEKMPSDIRVTNMSCTEEDVLITLEVSTKNEAAKVVDTMNDFDSLAEVLVSSVTDDEGESGERTVTLTLQCKYYPYGFTAEGDEEAEE